MKLLNLPYYKQLLKQYYKIPLAITLLAYGLSICASASLGLDEGPLTILGPLALALMVVLLSMRMFEHLHHALEVSHLLSTPLTRGQIYVTNVLAGLTLLFLPCTVISLGIDFEFHFWLSFIFLLIYYFILCCFSSIVCRKTLTNILFIIFLTIGFGVVIFLNHLVVNMYVFGGSFNFELNYLNIFIPLISGASFAIGNSWPYFHIHVLILIGLIALSFHQVKHLKIEEAENKKVVVIVIKPFVYAVLFLLLLWLFQVSFEGYHYNDTYYLRLFLVMAILSVVSAMLCQMWLTSSLHEVFSKNHFLQSVIYIALSFILFLVPFRFQPHLYPKQMEVSTRDYYSILYLDYNVEPMYRYIKDHPEHFKKDKGDITLWFNFDQRTERYYIDEKDMDETFRHSLYEMIKSNRFNDLEPVMLIQNNLYKREDFLKFISKIEEPTLPKDYFKNLEDYEYDGDYRSYHYALTNLTYDNYIQRLIQEVTPYLSQEDLNQMYNQVIDKVETYDVVVENMYYNLIEEGAIEISIDVTSLSEQVVGEANLFEDYYYTFNYKVTFDEHKEIQDIQLKEVF